MAGGSSLLRELKRRNVPRAAVLYVACVWALAQGIAQLAPAFGAPDWATRSFMLAAAIGFPFWLAFAWFYEFTPQGLMRESEIAAGDSIAHSTGRKLDFWSIAILAIAVVLLLTNRLVLPNDVATVAVAATSDNSAAVLPLVNESGNPHNA